MNKKAAFIDMKELQNEAFWKGLRVVQSCEKLEQLDTARRYVNRFIELYSEPSRKGLRVDSTIAQQYNVLMVALEEQEKNLN